MKHSISAQRAGSGTTPTKKHSAFYEMRKNKCPTRSSGTQIILPTYFPFTKAAHMPMQLIHGIQQSFYLKMIFFEYDSSENALHRHWMHSKWKCNCSTIAPVRLKRSSIVSSKNALDLFHFFSVMIDHGL